MLFPPIEKDIISLSRINLKTLDTNIAYDYFETISDLIDTKEVQDLKKCSQHLATSRFQHSLNVSYYSYLICRKFGLDAYSAARAGLLHDLYYYDWKTNDKRPLEGNHAKIHPWLSIVLPALAEGRILVMLPVCTKYHRRRAPFRVSSRPSLRDHHGAAPQVRLMVRT